jgi:hypothetical protein
LEHSLLNDMLDDEDTQALYQFNIGDYPDQNMTR